jgi:hypothetical protein
MKLGDLKKSLSKFPPDMNDMEVIIVVARKDKKEYEPLCFTGYLPLKGSECIALGTLTAVQCMVKNGEMPKPKGYIDPDDSNPLLFDEGE